MKWKYFSPFVNKRKCYWIHSVHSLYIVSKSAKLNRMKWKKVYTQFEWINNNNQIMRSTLREKFPILDSNWMKRSVNSTRQNSQRASNDLCAWVIHFPLLCFTQPIRIFCEKLKLRFFLNINEFDCNYIGSIENRSAIPVGLKSVLFRCVWTL